MGAPYNTFAFILDIPKSSASCMQVSYASFILQQAAGVHTPTRATNYGGRHYVARGQS